MAIAAELQLIERDLLVDRAYVGGQWIEADAGGTFAVTDPASGSELARVPRMGAAETRRAIDAANAAYPGWRATVAKERAHILRRWSDLMLEHIDDLALLMTAEQELNYGKLALALLGSPQKIPAILRLQRQTQFAARNLAKVLTKVLPGQ